MHPTLHQPELPLRFLTTLECAAARLGDPDHHLRKKPSGYWQLRVTIDRGPKLVGQRVILGLGTHDAEEARKRRDVVLAGFKKAGHVISKA